MPKIMTVMTKNDSSGNKGERIGSAVVPNEFRIDGVMIKIVMKTMSKSMVSIGPPGGGGGGGGEPFAMTKPPERRG